MSKRSLCSFSITTTSLFVCSLAATATGPAFAAPAEVQVTLARDGKAAATIVVAKQPARAAQFAAYELQWHLKQITGGDFLIVQDDKPVDGVAILVGDSAPVRALGIRPDQLQKQEYIIRFGPEALVLVGRDKDDHGTVQYHQTPNQQAIDTWPGIWDEQGTMYAVYDFLERHCNVRWFTATEFGTDCPRQATLTVTGSQLQRAPFMKYRYAAYPASENYDQYTGLWPAGSEGQKRWEAAAYPELHKRFDGGGYTLAKRGWNTLFRLRHREGGEVCPGNHSLYGYYRRFWAEEKGQEQLFEGRHADWFAQGYKGQPPQMCYTSRGLVEQVAQDACEFFETGKNYPGAQAGGDCFCVEPMDNAQFCKCADCQKWLTGRDADSPFFTNGRHSDYFFQFVNEVAKLVAPKHPDKHIVCLAYMTHGAPPQKFQLEPNVLVQYCFACNRLNYDRASYEHEVELLKAWREAYPGRTLYLWLYYTFPVEVANNGRFHCFPGFFARAVGEQFALFRQYDYRGAFHCGYGQEVEAYITYRLMDDPSLNVDTLLDEFFARQYGPAASPMRKFYDTVEKAYGDPANYPEAIATGRIEGHHHQTEELAWGYLGNAKRMEALGKLLEEAKAAAQTPEQKQRVTLFELGVWDYMTAGRQQYVEHVKSRYGKGASLLRVPFASRGSLKGDPAKIDEAESLALTGWRSRTAEPTRRKTAAWLLHDGQYLYVQLAERCDPNQLRSAADIASGDYWQVLFANEPGRQVHSLLVNALGVATLDGLPANITTSTGRGQEGCVVSLALPLAQMGLQSGGRFCLNVARRSGLSDDQPMWSPSFGAFESPAALRELTLDAADTIPAKLPNREELERLDAQGLVASWKLDERQGDVVYSTDVDLTGKLVNGASRERDGTRFVVRLQDSRQQYVDLGHAKAFDLDGPLSLVVWAKYEPTDVWYPALLGKGYEATGTYGMHIRPGGTVWFELDAPDGARHIYNPTDRCLTPGQWCHVAATYDGATMRVYLNGREAGTGKSVTTTIRANAEPLRFGWLGSYGHFNGSVRDARVYNRALSSAEVFAHYLAGK
ncbi:MAG TPA: DUF4838 domain-containing protein [Candidatus Anammoximicrobium sp.]|nr:DUF4838 domain-containing protein [Candidatus Anammoximicrobium sp.]